MARSREALGERRCSPIADLMVNYYAAGPILHVIRSEYPELKTVLDKVEAKQQQEALLKWLDNRSNDPKAAQFALWIRRYKSEYITLMTVLQGETGHGFRPLEKLRDVTAWTDARSDVFILWMNPQLQSIRKFFGYPTPIMR